MYRILDLHEDHEGTILVTIQAFAVATLLVFGKDLHLCATFICLKTIILEMYRNP